MIGARIARGETKTEVVKAMPGYASRRHSTFAAYDNIFYSACAQQGVIGEAVQVSSVKRAEREA